MAQISREVNVELLVDEGDMPVCMQAVQLICSSACDANTDWSQFSPCWIDQLVCLANGGGRLRCELPCR